MSQKVYICRASAVSLQDACCSVTSSPFEAPMIWREWFGYVRATEGEKGQDLTQPDTDRI